MDAASLALLLAISRANGNRLEEAQAWVDRVVAIHDAADDSVEESPANLPLPPVADQPVT